MSQNIEQPIIINFFDVGTIDFSKSVIEGCIFCGYVLIKNFRDVFLKMCEIINVKLILTDEIEKFLNNEISEHEYSDLDISHRKYRIRTHNSVTPDGIYKCDNLKYKYLSSFSYFYLQIDNEEQNTFENNVDIIFNKIQPFVENYDVESNTCYL